MTKDETQQYLSDHPQGDVDTWRHAIDPMDYDGGPFQRLACGPPTVSPVSGYPEGEEQSAETRTGGESL